MSRNVTTPSQGWALVTGASSGIGLQYARQLAGRGYALVIVSNEAERIVKVGEGLQKEYNVKVIALYRDLSLPDAASELFTYCEENRLAIEVLINNAGVFFFNDVVEVETRRIELMLDLHVRTVTLMCHYFGGAMKKRGKGYILNMSSMSAWMPFPGITIYAASKSYLHQFSVALRDELFNSGVSVTVVCPGAVATDLYNLSDRYKRLAIRLGIMMRPETLARKALRAMFARRRRIIPGALNHLFIPLMQLLPSSLVRLIKRKSKLYRYGK